MRLGIVLGVTDAASPLGGLAAQAAEAERVGLDLALVEAGTGAGPPLMTAALLAGLTATLRMVVRVDAGPHPLEIAEAIAVIDNASNGRTILCVGEPGGDAALLGETADALVAALAPRPFRHVGPRWTIPANRPENDGTEERIVLTPPPVQLELPLWLGGPAAPAVARERGLSHLVDPDVPDEASVAAWSSAGRRERPRRRPAVVTVDAGADGGFDADALVERLLRARTAWELDVALLRLPDGLSTEARLAAIAAIATWVRPRTTQDALPAGLVEHWKQWLPAHAHG